MTKTLTTLLTLFLTLSLHAQTAFQFADLQVSPEAQQTKALLVDADLLRKQLAKAPAEFSQKTSRTTVELPLPDGSLLSYRVWDADLLPNRPELGSYRVVNDFGTGRIAVGPSGISAVVQGPEGFFIIDAVDAAAGLYQVAPYREFMNAEQDEHGVPHCGFEDAAGQPDFTDIVIDPNMGEAAGAKLGGEKAGNEPRELRVYDLIMTNTGEFATRVGGSASDVQEAFNTAVSTVNAIFEPQVGVRMNLLDRPQVIFTDAATDPFSNAADGRGLLPQVGNAFAISMIPTASFDLGHIFTGGCSNGLGGVVSGAACTDGKTRGVTCVRGSIVGIAMRIMAHEIAHQFTVSHSWNNCPPSQEQRASRTAFEPGSGTTIMSYAGTCGNQNIGNEDPYYHVGSLEQFLDYTRRGGASTCATQIQTNNISPDVSLDYEDGFTIPRSTPFRLEGTATDANNDDLLYNWEQYDLGPAVAISNPSGSAPLFRSVPPTESGFVRYFPALNSVVEGINSNSEVLPDYGREMTFRLTAHDYNSEAGGVDWEELRFNVAENAGPFVVNAPEQLIWPVGSVQDITWDVAGTNEAPVNCRSVNVLLSTNDGRSFDQVLAANVPNNGRVSITVPASAITSTARIMIEAADNIFFNVGEEVFSVRAANEPGYTLATSVRYQAVCLPEVLDIAVRSSSILGFSEVINLEVDRGNLPDDVDLRLSEASVIPGETARLMVDLGGINFNGELTFAVLGITDQDTARRSITLDVTDTDYGDLETLTPEEGSEGIILSTTFDWTDAANAEDYQIQIATSADFNEASIFAELGGLEESEYTPVDFFETSTLYFWRVRPRNSCGFGDWERTQSFYTVTADCSTNEPSDMPMGLSGRGGSYTRESSVFVDAQGVISDLNIPMVDVRYNFISEMRLRLRSPAGTEVLLYDRRCRLSRNRLTVGFDDDAPTPVDCRDPSDGRVATPQESLSAFVGENTFGEWTMILEITETGGTAGSWESWNIEFCAAVNPERPTALNNSDSQVDEFTSVVISRSNLEVTSDDFAANNILYTLTEAPASGRLEVNGTTVTVGRTFTQADINDGNLVYFEESGASSVDDFGFVVTTPGGGYLPIMYHTVLIDNTVNTDDPLAQQLDASLRVFPNPTVGTVNLRWQVPGNQQLNVELFSLAGQRLRTSTVAVSARGLDMDISELPAGIYLVRVNGAVRRIVKR